MPPISDILLLLRKSLPFFLRILLRGTFNRLLTVHHNLTYNTTSSPKTVLVIGGSFAGLQTVRRLTQTLPSGYRVLWIEKNSHLNYCFAFPRFSVVSGLEGKAFIPYTGVEEGAVQGILERVQGKVVAVEKGRVKLEAEGQNGWWMDVDWTYLVIATGSSSSLPVRLAATEREGGCEELRGVQDVIKHSARIAVVGAGAVGVELASDVKEFFPEKDVTLFHSRGEVLSRFGPRLRKYALGALEGLGVKVLLNERPDIPGHGSMARDAVLELKDGRKEKYDLVINCTGQTPNSSLISSMCPGSISKSTSQILVHPTLQIITPDQPSSSVAANETPIFALGDVAAHPGPLMARAGFMQAEIVVSNILSMIKGNPAKAEYKPDWFIEGAIKLTLGKTHNVVYSRDEGEHGAEVLLPSQKGTLDLDVGRAWREFGVDIQMAEGREKDD
ncbi:hypothetical protein BJY04DRAFT_203576 [Aspergillus karnatakaensis]|uniref:uncharacterized protein n=1 Tax=Aspergillus karnatakaensis TaxID=1810916 RepID=UPI003CCE4FB6